MIAFSDFMGDGWCLVIEPSGLHFNWWGKIRLHFSLLCQEAHLRAQAFLCTSKQHLTKESDHNSVDGLDFTEIRRFNILFISSL
jgi:hypothetical protein